MYDVKNPKFFIKFGVSIIFFENLKTGEFDEGVISARQASFAMDFHRRFRGIRFKIETKKDVVAEKLRWVISFEVQPHKTVCKKILVWVKKHYPVSDLDVCWDE